MLDTVKYFANASSETVHQFSKDVEATNVQEKAINLLEALYKHGGPNRHTRDGLKASFERLRSRFELDLFGVDIDHKY